MKFPLGDHAQLPEKVKNMLMLSSFLIWKSEEYVFDITPGLCPCLLKKNFDQKERKRYCQNKYFINKVHKEVAQESKYLSRLAHSNNQYESRIFATNFFVYLLFEYLFQVKVLNCYHNTPKTANICNT